MSLANLVAWSAQAALLVVAGACVARAARVRDPRVMLGFWQALLAAALLLPLAQPRPQSAPPTSAGVSSWVERASTHPAGLPIGPAIGAVLAAGCALRLARLGLGLSRLRRYRESARALDPLPPALREEGARLRSPAAFLVSDEIAGPVTFGHRRPVVLLPRAVLGMPAELQRAIACHELLHVRRRDWVLGLGEECLRSALWFHPPLRWLLRRIRAAREQCVDREAVSLTGARQPYVEALLAIARLGLRGAAPAAPFLGESHLALRVDLLLKEDSMSKARLFAVLAAKALSLTLAGAAAAWAFPIVGSGPAEPPAHAPGKGAPPASEGTTEKKPGKARKPVHRVDAVYPEQARRDGIEGVVTVQVVIEKDGSVSDATVIRSRGPLDEAAIAALRQWRFEPSDVGPVKADISIKFELGDKDGKKP
jgi:TonB family protein